MPAAPTHDVNIIVLDTDALPGSYALIAQITGYEFTAKGCCSVGALFFIRRAYALALVSPTVRASASDDKTIKLWQLTD